MGYRLAIILMMFAVVPQGQSVTVSRVSVGGEHHVIRHWDAEDGLPGNRILSLLTASNGYLWIGTEDGLSRFDGMRFNTERRATHQAFVSEACLSLAESPDGRLWIGTRDGLLRRQPGSGFERFTEEDGLPGSEITAIGTSTEGTVYVGTNRGLAAMPSGADTFTRWGPEWMEPMSSLAVDSTDRVWAASSVGLFRVDQNGRDEVFSSNDRGLPASALAVSEGGQIATVLDGRVWVVKDKLEPVRSPFVDASKPETVVTFDREGRLIAASAAGLSRFDLNESMPGAHLPFDLGPCQAVVVDRHGRIWVATESQGLFCVERSPFLSVGQRDGLATDSVRCIYEDSHGNVWVGTQRGLAKLRLQHGSAGTSLHHRIAFEDDVLTSNRITAMVEDDFGWMWIGTHSGINLIDRFGVTGFHLPGEWFASKIRSLQKSDSGTLWVGTATGLLAFPKEAYRYVEKPSGSSLSRLAAPRTLVYDHSLDVWAVECVDDDVWIGTRGDGVFRILWDGRDLRVDRHLDVPSVENVGALAQDGEDKLWIGSDQGLVRHSVSQQETFHFQGHHGLPEEAVNEVIIADDQRLWMTTDSGIYMASLVSLDACATGSRPSVPVTHFDELDGLPSNVTHGQNSHPGACQSQDGGLWFATDGGAVWLDPKKGPHQTGPPDPIIETVSAGGLHVGTQDPLTIAPNKAHLVEFAFAVPITFPSEEIGFRYRLFPQQSEWVDSGAGRLAQYTDLGYGNHRFEVQALSSGGQASMGKAVLSFHIARHWYQAPLFYWTLALFVTGLSLLVRKRLERGALRIEMAERDRLTQVLHDDLGNRFRELRAAAEKGDARTLIAEIDEAEEAVRDQIWFAESNCDSTQDLLERAGDYAAKCLHEADIRCRLDFPAPLPAYPLNREVRQALFLTMKESVSNVIKHSQADTFKMLARMEGAHLKVTLQDNGVGMETSNGAITNGSGHGLRHMKKRLKDLGVDFSIDSVTHQGTTIQLVTRVCK